MPSVTVPLSALRIDDERSLKKVPLYTMLKSELRSADYKFVVLTERDSKRWDRALLLNLAFWGEGDVLESKRIFADMVAHAAWHHLARKELGSKKRASPEALFLGESIASAFDLFILGHLLREAPEAQFLATQVPRMAEVAEEAGLKAKGFQALLEDVAEDPESAFEDLRQLLFDATRALYRAKDPTKGLAALARFDDHRFAPLLHHYELASWVLYARAYADPSAADARRAKLVDRRLRKVPFALEWLAEAWLYSQAPF